MPKMILDKEEAQEIVCGDHIDFETIEEKVVDHGRWTIYKEGIFRRLSDNTYWSSSWGVGATEYQDEFPFDHTTPEFFQVEPKEVTVIEYVPVGESV